MPNFRQGFLLITYGILLTIGLLNYDNIRQQLNLLLAVLNPITYGFVLAYLLTFIKNAVDRPVDLLLSKSSLSLLRFRGMISILITLTITFFFFRGIFAVVIPELSQSFILLRQRAPEISYAVTDYVNNILQSLELTDDFWMEVQRSLANFTNQLLQIVTDSIPMLVSWTSNLATAVWDIFIGIIISIYLLAGRDSLISQIDTAYTSLASDSFKQRFAGIGAKVSRSFNNYVKVRLIETVIVFVIMALGMQLLGIPYVILIAAIAGFTNLIPIFGPLFATFPCFFLIAVTDIQKAVFFLILHILVQIFDANFLAPHLLGSTQGMPAIWVLISVLIGGGLFGLPGLIVATPLVTVLYELLGQYIERHRGVKSMSSE